jgi:D-aspartate ligase
MTARWRGFVVACSLSAWIAAGVQLGSPVAFIVVLVFMATCPGSAFVRRLDIDDPVLTAALVVAGSLALDVLAAEALLYVHAFTGLRAVGVLAFISIVGMLIGTRTVPVSSGRAVAPAPGGRRAPVPVHGPRVELDREVPVVLVRVGRYPIYHGTVGAIRSLGRANVPVHAIVEDRLTPAALSRYLTSKIVWPTTGTESADYLVEHLDKIGRELGGGVIAIPSDDEAAVLLAEHGDVLRDWFIYPDIDPELPRLLASKRGLHRICREHDVPTPKAVFPRSPRDVRAFAKKATFPVVAKNVDPFRRLSDKAVDSTTVLQTPEELLALGLGLDDPRTVMFQEYIPREEAEDWIFHTYCDANSDCLVSFTGIKLRSWPPHAGVTTHARVVRNDELAALSQRLCKDIGYRGIADLDWRFDRRDGQYKLVDFNPRTGAQFRLFENEHGIDVLRALHLDLTGREVPDSPPVYGRGIVVEHLDRPAWLAYRGGHATAPEGVAKGPRSERAWFAGDDLLPFGMMLLRFSGTVFGKLRPKRRRTAAASPGLQAHPPKTAGEPTNVRSF